MECFLVAEPDWLVFGDERTGGLTCFDGWTIGAMSRVFVGMSGGVDSSLVASLLVEQGHEVVGVYMKNWSQDLPGMKCPWAEDLADAKRVAVQLGIDFRVYDFETEYKQRVVDYMVEEYKLGRTPNPDIMCNQEIKFRLFLDTALADGAEMVATGHYARAEAFVENDTGKGRLMLARDGDKDQTYFLYRINGKSLTKVLFPLGDYTKPEVRAMAEARRLWTASKKESMGVCFVGSVGIREFLGQYVTTRPGDIVEQESQAILGRHDGAIYYTLGQRHGLDIGGGLPYYVVGKDMAENRVFVSRNINDQSMWRKEFTLQNIHWINQPPTEGVELKVRLRHRGKMHKSRLEHDKLFLTDSTERAVAPGQSAVVYAGDECLGGAVVA